MRHRLKAVLLDVGGTLWPDVGPTAPNADEMRLLRACAALPFLSQEEGGALLHAVEVRTAAADSRDPLAQDTDGLLRAAAQALRLDLEPAAIVALRKAICLPAAQLVTLFPGAADLFATIKGLGLACVLVTNVGVRDAEISRQDFTDLGVSDFIDAIVTSHDVGYRKPHRAMFDAAVTAVGCRPEECVMVGNREQLDIAPALALGMRTILVAIEDPPPATTAAHAVATSLPQVAALLRQGL